MYVEQQRRAPLGFGDLEVPVPSHVCLFYYDDVELREKLGFLRLGLESEKEAAVLFGRRPRLMEVLGYLAAEGLDTDAHLEAGRLVLIEGAAEAEALLGNIGRQLDALMASGVELIRFLGFIGWEDPAWPTHEELLAFESEVNNAAASYPAVVICTYRLTDIPGPLLIYGGIEMHAMTIIGKTICENPHFVVPERFAAERAGKQPWLTPGRDRFKGVRISRGSAAGE